MKISYTGSWGAGAPKSHGRGESRGLRQTQYDHEAVEAIHSESIT